MCFMKKAAKMAMLMPQPAPAKVERHQADASVTKHSQNDNEPKGYLQNLKTTPMGLFDNPETEKKTLLGE